MSQPAKRQKINLSLEQKIKVIDEIKNKSRSEIAKDYNISERTICRIIANKDELVKDFENNEKKQESEEEE